MHLDLTYIVYTYSAMQVLISEIVGKFTSLARSASEAIKRSGASTYSWALGHCKPPNGVLFFGLMSSFELFWENLVEVRNSRKFLEEF